MAMLTLEGVCCSYGTVEVLHDVNLVVNEGEIVTLLGANGAGKTTTLLTISGIIRPKKGRVSFLGKDLAPVPSHEIVRLGLAHSPEGRKIFPRMTVLENLELGAVTRKDKVEIKADMERMFGLFPILAERRAQTGGTLSGGEQQMLAVARALMSRPKLLLLDEPSLGLAPLIILKIFEVLVELNRQGMTLMLVEQNARLALRIAHSAYVIETGRITMQGPSAQIAADPRIQDAYLGGGH
jgi:branched-chain amino acid transport system ATP-binding protein